MGFLSLYFVNVFIFLVESYKSQADQDKIQLLAEKSQLLGVLEEAKLENEHLKKSLDAKIVRHKFRRRRS